MKVLMALISWGLLGLPVALVFRYFQRSRLGLALLPFAGLLSIAGAPVLAGWFDLPLARWPLLAGLTVLARVPPRSPVFGPGGPDTSSQPAGSGHEQVV